MPHPAQAHPRAYHARARRAVHRPALASALAWGALLLVTVCGGTLLLGILGTGWGTGPALAAAPAPGCLRCHPGVQPPSGPHAAASCTDCHLGNAAATDFAGAHAKLVKKPGEPQAVPLTCGRPGCHAALAKTYPTSLHATVQGLKHGALDMLGQERGKFIGENRCGSCHATCEDCHLKKGKDGKFLSPHALTARVGTENCKLCHDQTGTGYAGHDPEFAPSVHAKAGMTCADCHKGVEVHGTGKAEQRMADVPRAKCEDCHTAALAGVVAHKLHAQTVDCSACHVTWYYNCYGCHGYDKDGNALGYDNFNSNRYLARRRDNGKLAAVVHIPMSREVGGEKYLKGAWVFKDRHSVQKGALGCQDCHLNAQAFVMDGYREAPFLGAVAGEFVPKDEVTNKILIFRSHAKLLGGIPKPGQTPDSVCLKCHR